MVNFGELSARSTPSPARAASPKPSVDTPGSAPAIKPGDTVEMTTFQTWRSRGRVRRGKFTWYGRVLEVAGSTLTARRLDGLHAHLFIAKVNQCKRVAPEAVPTLRQAPQPPQAIARPVLGQLFDVTA